MNLEEFLAALEKEREKYRWEKEPDGSIVGTLVENTEVTRDPFRASCDPDGNLSESKIEEIARVHDIFPLLALQIIAASRNRGDKELRNKILRGVGLSEE